MNVLITVRTTEGPSSPIYINIGEEFQLLKVVNSLLNQPEEPKTTRVEMVFTSDEANIQDLVMLILKRDKVLN